ncbi:medium-chain fatty acid-CoA ligase faa2 [Coemansia erecta]|uniref:Medium-chain fatty acid-CoA ligase faa2 n=1 Tax=Coemansia erecta TaxID=147472 RepID=A0A9W8CQX5_9FUNG|nr:medium-chain fatty acid-CoA ligase faa2 [Coemansia erecta]
MLKSFVVPSSRIPGFSPIYRHPDYKDGTHKNKYSDITTLYELFKAQVKSHPKDNFLGHRTYYPETDAFGDYEWLTTTDVDEMVDDYGSGLDQLFAAHAPDMDEETGQQPLGFSFNIEVIVCSMDKIPSILEFITRMPKLKVIVSMDKLDCSKPTLFTQAFNVETTEILKAKAALLDILLTDVDQVIEMGCVSPTKPTLPTPSTYCTLVLSSGTTGASKGALITHGAFAIATHASHLGIQQLDTTYLSFMPPSHIFERYVIYTFMHDVIHIGSHCGIRGLLLSDIQTLRPSVLVTTPLLLNTVYDKVASATVKAKGIPGIISRFAYKSKLKRINSGRGFKHTLWDKLIFGKVAQLFGGSLRLVILGAVSANPDVHNFFRAALSCNIIQGYGQTESIASGAIQKTDDVSTGNTGIPSPGVDIRLRSIPEMGYDATSRKCPRGEIMIRSKSIFSGYYKLPEKTAEVMDGEWLATSDVAQFNPDGTLTIIDRIQNVACTASGSHIALEPLEMAYGGHRLVGSVLIHGSMRSHDLVAIVVPKPETFVPWAQKIAGNRDVGLTELCKDERVVDAMTNEFRILASKAKVPLQALVGAVYLEPREFVQINRDFFTVALKLRRFKLFQHYESVIDGMYQKLAHMADSDIKTSGSS